MLTNFHIKYKVECKIGEGSFSEVLKCQERSSGKSVAAKQLKKHFKSINHASEIPELMVLKKISKHPNLLELYDSYYDPSSGKVTLVFELMDMSLYDLMKTRKRPVPESRAKKFLYQIIKGIDHLHYHGIFHRDIKPENVLVKGEKVKISDMGSIKGFYSKQPYTEYISTRWYRSPECLLTKGFYGPKMDIWAMGCVYYELLTLKPLFPGADELDQIAKINQVLGSPSVKLMNKLKKIKCRNLVPTFPHKKGTGLNAIIPMITEEGREIFKQMIVYDPDSRINVRRLLEHKYFNDIRHEEMLSQKLLSTQSMTSSGKLTTSPMWLSFITATKKRRIKRKISQKPSTEKKVLKTQQNMAPRVSTVVSSEVSFSNKTGCSDDEDGPDIQVYKMKPSIIKEENHDEISNDESLTNDKLYNHSDKIPGYEQFAKQKIQSLGSKALVGLGFVDKPRRKESSNFFKSVSMNQINRNMNSLCQTQSVDPRQHQTFKTIQRELDRELHHIQKSPEQLSINVAMKRDEKMRKPLEIRPKIDYNHFQEDRSVISIHNSKPLEMARNVTIKRHPSKNTMDMKPSATNVLPTTADTRNRISPKSFHKRTSDVSRLIDVCKHAI